MGEFEKEIREVIEENEKHVDDYLEGTEEALNYLVGQVMEKTGGSMNPVNAHEQLQEQIKKVRDTSIDWPVVLTREVSVGDRDTQHEQLWNHLREREKPTPDPDDVEIPDRFTVPRVMVEEELYEDGSTVITNVEVSFDDS